MTIRSYTIQQALGEGLDEFGENKINRKLAATRVIIKRHNYEIKWRQDLIAELEEYISSNGRIVGRNIGIC